VRRCECEGRAGVGEGGVGRAEGGRGTCRQGGGRCVGRLPATGARRSVRRRRTLLSRGAPAQKRQVVAAAFFAAAAAAPVHRQKRPPLVPRVTTRYLHANETLPAHLKTALGLPLWPGVSSGVSVRSVTDYLSTDRKL